MDVRSTARSKSREAAGEAHARAANEAYADLLPLTVKLRGQGWILRKIADRLDRMGHTTRRGKARSPTQVVRVLRRMDR